VPGSERERVTDSVPSLVACSKLDLVASSVLRPAVGSGPDLVPRQKDASELCWEPRRKSCSGLDAGLQQAVEWLAREVLEQVEVVSSVDPK
jgi:hypothetical protein